MRRALVTAAIIAAGITVAILSALAGVLMCAGSLR